MITTHRYGVVGYPLNHSLSAVLHPWFFKALGMKGEYKTYPIKPAALNETFKALVGAGVMGFNVTLPHKEAIVPLLDDLSEAAQSTGAVNTVQMDEGRLVGHNTDVSGFSQMLIRKEVMLKDKGVLLIGAGGAAKSVVHALLAGGVREVIVLNRSFQRAEALCKRMERTFPSPVALSPIDSIDSVSFSKIDVIINATPVGMWPNVNQTPFLFKTNLQQKIAIDLVYNPLRTQFLKQAALAGATAIDGLDMLIYQGAASLQIWLGLDKPFDYDLAGVRSCLQDKLESMQRLPLADRITA